jgi:hypothetical protein
MAYSGRNQLSNKKIVVTDGVHIVFYVNVVHETQKGCPLPKLVQ